MRWAAGLLLLAISAQPAMAQQRKPIPVAVFDAHVFYPNVGADEQTIKDLDLQASELPTRLFGVALRGQVYVLRWTGHAIGLGGDAIRGSASHALVDAITKQPTGVVTKQILEGITGFLSFNFGKREGWSYFGAGIGPVRLRGLVETPPLPASPAAPGKLAITYGAGARWFSTDHFAFSFDIRFYDLKPIATTDTTPGRRRQRLLLMSAGVSLK